jgi:hypothetical protein
MSRCSNEPPYEQTAEGTQHDPESGIPNRCPESHSEKTSDHYSLDNVEAEPSFHFDSALIKTDLQSLG